MGREEVFGFSLRRFERASTAALIAVVLVGSARANTIRVFGASGRAQNLSGMDLGAVASTTIPLDRIKSFCNELEGSGPLLRFGYWMSSAGNNTSETLSLSFPPEPTPASLVDLKSGSLVGDFTVKGPAGSALYARLRGSVTPGPESSPVPGPSSLALLGTGLIGLGALAKRNLKRRATASSQTEIRKPVPVLVGAKWPRRGLESTRLLTTIVSIELGALDSLAQNRRNASGNLVERAPGSS